MSAFRHRCTAAAVAALLALVLAPSAGAAEPIDRIVAVVNDGVILESELAAQTRFVRERMQRGDRQLPPDDVLRERVLEQLVLERIQLQRAERAGITVDDAAVNNALENMAERNGTDVAGLRQRLAGEGIEFEQLREDVRRQLIVSRLRQRQVASRVQISEREVQEAIDRVDRASDQRTEYRLQHILLSVPSDAPDDEIEATRERAQQLAESLRGGRDFAQAATRVSDGPEALGGGDLGWRSGTSLPELFLDAIRDRSPGSVTDPLRSRNGFHILKLADRRGGLDRTVTQIRARQILLSAGDGAEDPRERLASLRSRIRSGADFAELARAHSDDEPSARKGGDLGWIGPGEMPRAFMQVAEGLEPGTLSEPFRTPLGWHLVEVLDRRERQDAEQYRRARARRALYQRQLEQEVQRWHQRLRDEAYVELRTNG